MNTYSLTELCSLISETLADGLPSTYWVRAEISSLATKGGHAYFDLIEKGERNTFAAKVRAICWRNVWGMLSAYFEAQTSQPLQPGMQVLVEVEVNFNAAFGLSLLIHNIDPTFTLGDLAQQRQATLQRLQEDGVLELNKSLPFPTRPQRIAVISAADAAGYGDFCNQLTNNPYHFAFQVTLFSALMQGERAAQSIIEALDRVQDDPNTFDVVLILRGGGATTDLACFDNYDLAFYCANYPLPVVAGIGHQRDVSVVDIVAHTSVKTPTAAAELLVERILLQAQRLEDYSRRLKATADKRILLAKHRFDRVNLRLENALRNYILKQHEHLRLAEKTLELRSPEKIYQMGYSLTRVNGKPLRSIHDAPTGTTLQTELLDGTITSTVNA